MKLKGAIVIVTGGAGGIGSVVSKYFHNEGAEVIIFCRSKSRIGYAEYSVDVSNYKAVYRAVGLVLKK